MEGIFKEKMGDCKDVQVVGVVCPVTLQGAEVICVPDFCSQFFENRPVALLPLVTNLTFQMISQVGGHPVVVEQRVYLHQIEKLSSFSSPRSSGRAIPKTKTAFPRVFVVTADGFWRQRLQAPGVSTTEHNVFGL